MTLLGEPTVSELEELVKTKNYTVKQLTDAYTAFRSTWMQKNPVEHDAWLEDWRIFAARYGEAVKHANTVISAANAVFWVPNQLIAVSAAYNGVLKACTASESGSYGPDDLQGLHNRLVEASQKKVDFKDQPQPSKGADFDTGVYNAAGLATKALEDAASKTASSPFTWALVGIAGLATYVAIKR